MNEQDVGTAAAMFSPTVRPVHDGTDNPLWIGSTPIDHDEVQVPLDSTDHVHHSGLPGSPLSTVSELSVSNGASSQGSLELAASTRPTTRRNLILPDRSAAVASTSQQTMMMDAYIEKFSTPVCTPYPATPAFSYPSGISRTGYKEPSVLHHIDLSHRPGSLQEAICMYIDFLMAENEIRTRISECAIASPAPPLDFHREDYYRDVMCRPVSFPTARFRDWLKRYNVDIEITDPDGQTVSQTTFAPATPMSDSSEARPSTDGGPWPCSGPVPAGIPVTQHRRRRSVVRGGVICQAGGPGVPQRPVQLPLTSLPPTYFPIQNDAEGISTSMLNPLPDGYPMQATTDFTTMPAEVGPVPSGMYAGVPIQQAQDGDQSHPYIQTVDGYGYGPPPGHEDGRSDVSPRPEMAVSGWPDVSLAQPESSRSVAAADAQNFNQNAPDPSSIAYFQDERTAAGGGTRFDSSCFASDEAAASDRHWTSGVIHSPVSSRRIIDVDTVQDSGDDLEHAQFPQICKTSHASGPMLNVGNGGAFPVVIKPPSPSDPANDGGIAVGSAGSSMVRDFSECFGNGDGGVYRLDYGTANDPQLCDARSEPQLDTDAPPQTVTPPTRASDPSTCLDLGADFADLLGAQHSDEFDYHLTYGGSMTPNLTSEEELSHDVLRSESQRQKPHGRSGKTRSSQKTVVSRDDAPRCKSSRRE